MEFLAEVFGCSQASVDCGCTERSSSISTEKSSSISSTFEETALTDKTLDRVSAFTAQGNFERAESIASKNQPCTKGPQSPSIGQNAVDTSAVRGKTKDIEDQRKKAERQYDLIAVTREKLQEEIKDLKKKQAKHARGIKENPYDLIVNQKMVEFRIVNSTCQGLEKRIGVLEGEKRVENNKKRRESATTFSTSSFVLRRQSSSSPTRTKSTTVESGSVIRRGSSPENRLRNGSFSKLEGAGTRNSRSPLRVASLSRAASTE